MALFKNLYLDLSYLNPVKKKKQDIKNASVNIPPQKQDKPVFITAPLPSKKYRELPQVSKRLLEDTVQKEPAVRADIQSLPSIKKREVAPPPSMDNLPASAISPPVYAPEKIVSQDMQPILQAQISMPQEISRPSEKILPGSSGPKTEEADSFFSNVSTHISAEDGTMHSRLSGELLDKNLMVEMQNFWQDRKEGAKKTLFNKAVKTDLMKKIEELQKLETDWQSLQMQHENLKDQLSSKEILIEANIKYLKRALKKLHSSSDVRPENFFILANGEKLRGLQDLADKVRSLDENVFRHHVNAERNDFATWINDVMGLSDLSGNIQKTQTKEQLGDLLEKWFNSI